MIKMGHHHYLSWLRTPKFSMLTPVVHMCTQVNYYAWFDTVIGFFFPAIMEEQVCMDQDNHV